jgi:hypothetical protein
MVDEQLLGIDGHWKYTKVQMLLDTVHHCPPCSHPLHPWIPLHFRPSSVEIFVLAGRVPAAEPSEISEERSSNFRRIHFFLKFHWFLHISAWHVLSCSWSQSIDQLPFRPFTSGQRKLRGCKTRNTESPWTLAWAQICSSRFGTVQMLQICFQAFKGEECMLQGWFTNTWQSPNWWMSLCWWRQSHCASQGHQLFGSLQSPNFSGWCDTSGRPTILWTSRCILCWSTVFPRRAWHTLATT